MLHPEVGQRSERLNWEKCVATQTGPQIRVGLIGTGKMASALAKGWVESGWLKAEFITGTDVLPAAREQFGKHTGCKTAASVAEVVNQSEVLVLAVKPQHMGGVLDEMRKLIEDQHLIVSIAAGVTIATISQALGGNRRLIRVMPNTPALVGAGASAFALGGTATSEDAQLVEHMLSTVGLAVQVPEGLLDAVTGLSGSGPAYVYQIIEALSDGGVRVGLPRDIATRLAAQTVLGAARMVLETGEHPGALKDAVTSPGGTTIAGLHAMEAGGVRGHLINAVVAATERSRELGRQ
jgi:pyrroline-5-carboxylate reductase